MTKPIDPTADVQTDLCDALERARPRMAQLPKSKLLRINLDPLAAAALVRGALPNLLAMRPLLAMPIYSFDISDLDLLETYALALMRAEAVYRTVNYKQEELPKFLDEAFEVREQLVEEANVLVKRRLLSAGRVSRLNVPNGYRNIGADLLTLVTALRENWSQIASHTAIRPAELDFAAGLGDKLICGIALRERTTCEAIAAADDRQRAFTLLVHAYNEVRWVVLFLRRHEGDADKIAPSLYGGRSPRRKKPEPSDATEASDNTALQSATREIDFPQTTPKDSNDSSVRNNTDDPFIH